jgi:hypothetical protein
LNDGIRTFAFAVFSAGGRFSFSVLGWQEVQLLVQSASVLALNAAVPLEIASATAQP